MRSLGDRAGAKAGSNSDGSPDPEITKGVVERVRSAVAASLTRTGLVRSSRRIVVAVSGGADSLCLLDALVAVTPRAIKRLIVGHVDHQLRPTSAVDAAHVAGVAETYGVPCAVLTVDVPALAAATRRGIEEAARLGRYQALLGLAEEHGQKLPAVVATGHTAADVAETVLLHLLRGSGRAGLGGINEQENLPASAFGIADAFAPSLSLVRPLLNVGRSDTVAYCEARGLRWLTDETNVDPRMLRNRVRAHLLPVLRTYNPAIDRALTRTAAAVTDDEVWLERLVTRLWRRLARSDQSDASEATIALSAWQRQPVAAQRRLVRHFAVQIGYWEIGFDAVERALRVGLADGPPRAQLGGGLTVERRAGTLRFVRHGDGPPAESATPGREHDEGV